MTLREVHENDTPNAGRLIWNANDQELARRLELLALNVRTAPYDARGDGTSDDRPAIQAAIDACNTAGGGYVYLPAGTYLINSGPLLLKDQVGLIGTGMHSTTLRLGPSVAGPVIADEASAGPTSYAFGRAIVANLGIDGQREQNPNGAEGIFTSAYYSIFENLFIRNCRSHGIRMGFNGMSNTSSQNKIAGCRIAECDGAGVYLDIHSVDHLVTENQIRNCTHGVVINNGGVRVTHNAIFGHTQAAIVVQQTAYNVIISGNDLNANQRHGIYVTRTTVGDSGPWSQVLITGNTILGDFLVEDQRYDGIYVETSVPEGITKMTIAGNKIFAGNTSNRFRYGVNLEDNVTQTRCTANHITDAAAGPYHVGSTCSAIELDSVGGRVLGPPDIPASGTALANPYHVAVTVYVSGGAVSDVSIGDQPTGLTSGAFRLPALQTIALTYTSAPTWTWIGD